MGYDEITKGDYMKFFTKDRYLQLQVMVNTCLKDDLEYTIKKQYWQRFFCMNPLLINYLPESILKSIYDVNTKQFLEFPLQNLTKDIKEWSQIVRNQSEDSIKEYRKHYEYIKNQLPEKVLDINRNYNFHDSEIRAVKVGNSRLMIELEYIENYCLTFTGLKSVKMSDQIIGDRWIYDEIHLSEIGKFDLRVLLESKEGCLILHELEVIADDVIISRT